MTQSIHGRMETASLVLDSKSHSQISHYETLPPSGMEIWEIPRISIKNTFQFCNPREWQYLKGMLRDSPDKINSICFHIPRKYTTVPLQERAPPCARCQKTPQGWGSHWPQQCFWLKGLPWEAPRLSAICKKGQCKSSGSALCRHGLRHVDFCQAHIFLKHALSSPLIYSSQATEICPLHPKASIPPQLIEVDISNLRTLQQRHLKTPQPF